MTEQPHPQIRILLRGAGITAESAARQVGIEALRRVIAAGFPLARQTRSVGRQVEERDLLAAARWHPYGRRQIHLHRIVELHFAALNHVFQQQSGENFGDGADVGRGYWRRRCHRADDLRALFIDETDDQRVGLSAGANIVVENRLNL